jgi:hypothetical protein
LTSPFAPAAARSTERHAFGDFSRQVGDSSLGTRLEIGGPGRELIRPGRNRQRELARGVEQHVRPPHVARGIDEQHRKFAHTGRTWPPDAHGGANAFVPVTKYRGVYRARFADDGLEGKAAVIDGRPYAVDDDLFVRTGRSFPECRSAGFHDRDTCRWRGESVNDSGLSSSPSSLT